MMARALASSCSTSTQKVAFFMRKVWEFNTNLPFRVRIYCRNGSVNLKDN
jgi:hypothetical protein